MSYLYENGESAYSLADKFEVSESTVRKWLKRNGVDLRSLSEARKLGFREGRIDGELWTEEEKNKLRDIYPHKKNKDVADELNRSKRAVRRMKEKLGLEKSDEFFKKYPHCTVGEKWSDDEIKFLENNYDSMLKGKIVSEINRTWISIKCKASKMGLKRSKKVKETIDIKNHKPIGISNEDASYLAGVIDSDGSITFIKNHDIYFNPVVSVTNMSKNLIKKIEKITEVSKINYISKKGLWKWETSSRRDVYGILKSIKEYLIIKKKQAELTLNFIEIWVDNFGETNDDMINIANKVRELNNRTSKEMNSNFEDKSEADRFE